MAEMMKTDNSITDPKNVWKLIYACFIACEYAPDTVLDGNLEDVGEWKPEFIMPELKDIGREELDFNKINYSQALRLFVYEYDKGILSYPFTYEEYLENKDIIDTVKAFGLDEEKFWYAIVFIYYLTKEKFTDTISLDQSAIRQMRRLHEFMSGREVSITVKKQGAGKTKKTLEVSNILVIETLRDILADKIEAVKDSVKYRGVKLNDPKRTYSNTLMIGFMTEVFQSLFRLLELERKRATHTNEIKYLKHGTTSDVSFDRQLLISRIVYFTGLTDNDSFLYSTDSLKGILAQCIKDNPTFETGITRIPIS